MPLQALLDLVAPTTCAVCGAVPGSAPFARRGAPVPGLRAWDDVPACRSCLAACGPPRRARLEDGGRGWPVWAACATGPGVAGLVAAWKYRGRRGLAWPLAGLLLLAAWADGGPPPGATLVPVPLHRGRRRRRGFNQAALLARLVGAGTERPVDERVLRRARATGQQALLADASDRLRNVAGAFAARPARRAGGPALLLVDDVVTTGATAAAAARALEAAGHAVAGVLAVATSLPAAGPVDTPRAGF